jgi:hypothetical protein
MVNPITKIRSSNITIELVLLLELLNVHVDM